MSRKLSSGTKRQNDLFNDKMKIKIYCPSNMLQTLCKFLPHNEQQGFIYFHFILTTCQIFIAVKESTILDHQKVAYNFQSTKLLSFVMERLGLYIRHIYDEMYLYYIPSFKVLCMNASGIRLFP